LLLRDCREPRVHRPLYVVGLCAKWTRDTLWHFLRAAKWPRNRKRLPTLRAGYDLLPYAPHYMTTGGAP